ncbi:glycoside hydrolase superfamily [Clohesyomyces aquaticus]|uniref:Glycoside hydrolase superfamily n=1 Tax=Clohesyomyces aquaticus TaxID=1231657 RepID=A0A1Y1YQ76_9PLEO|nr:glycoside hydrolase superfamily [Clohesyomyces aquaticus]
MPPPPPTHLPPTQGPRLIVYAQTFHAPDGSYHSLLPLITNHTGVTHVIVAAIHVNEEPEGITLNDHSPEDERYNTLWSEVRWLQGTGVKVLGMLGGAARGSYGGAEGEGSGNGGRLGGGRRRCTALITPHRHPLRPAQQLYFSPSLPHKYSIDIPMQFERYYAPLHRLITTHSLDGLDLDIEEPVPLSVPSRLISRLRLDFGPTFLITLAPVATALLPDPNIPSHLRPPRPVLASGPCPNPLAKTLPHLSGFSYPELECSVAGQEVAWYNTQFYCGWGDAGSERWYEAIVAAGWRPERVVMGVVTNPGNGSGHVGIGVLRDVCMRLRAKYKDGGNGSGFGGVMGWEYFNAGDHDEDIEHVASLELNNETVQAGWVGALGRVLRSVDPPEVEVKENKLSGITAEQIRKMVSTLPEPETAWPEEHVNNLVVLGFSKLEAVQALNATDGNVDLAAGFLFEQYPS